MSEQIVYEVTQPYHPDGKTVIHAPGDLLPLDADLPEGLLVRKVIADIPDRPAPKAAAAKAPAGRSQMHP